MKKILILVDGKGECCGTCRKMGFTMTKEAQRHHIGPHVITEPGNQLWCNKWQRIIPRRKKCAWICSEHNENHAGYHGKKTSMPDL